MPDDGHNHPRPRANADLIPARMCNELVYCPRLFHLEHVQGIFIDSADTVSGRAEHKRAAKRGTTRRRSKSSTAKDDGATAADGSAEGGSSDEALADLGASLPPRSVAVQSEAWGVTGKFDMVELSEGEVVVVEYKHGRAPKQDVHRWEGHPLAHGAWPADVCQVGLYMALLRDLGLPCEEGRIYYRASRTLRRVPWSDDLERFLRAVVERARDVASASKAPGPLVDSPKCYGCSLHEACLPDEHLALAARAANAPEPEVRRIVAGRDDRAVVHVVSPGAVVAKDGEAILVKERDGSQTRVPLIDVQHVALFGRTHITEPCMQHLLRCGIPVSHHSSAGFMTGITAPLMTVNVPIRRAQYRTADEPARCLEAARGFVLSKIRNQRTILRRYRRGMTSAPERGDDDSMPEWCGPEDSEEREDRDALAAALARMKNAHSAAGRATTVDALRGHEGDAAAQYFAALPHVLPAAWRGDLAGRTRRPPRDRVNALLSFGYALLTREATAALARVGLDPMLGLYHTMVPGRPALALDLMEPFRPAWVDTAILRLLATNGIERDDFHVTLAGVALTDKGRRALIQAYERRADELTTHPRFGYRMSYRRMLELEARVLCKWLLGEIDHLEPMWTR